MSTTSSSTSTGTVTLSGFFSGLDTETILSKIQAADEIPITNLQSQSSTLTTQTNAYKDILSSLGNLTTTIATLNDPDLYRSHTATLADTSLGTATADSTAANGTFNINITQVATSSVLRSGTGTTTQISAVPAATSTISSVSGMDVSNKTFTINGKTITLTGNEVIDDGNASSTSSVIGKINNSGAGVTATYNSTNGTFKLVSTDGSSTVILGSGADTSNFLKQAQLFNNGTSTVTSTIGIGRINATADLSTQKFGIGTATTGNFYVNGVAIDYTSGDTLSSVISKINQSSAGVTATYDSYTDRLILTSSTRGAQGISVTDGTSNLGSALRLTSGNSSLTIGKATLFTVGDDPTVRQSDDETLTADELGVKGVTVSATAKGSTTISIGADSSKVLTALNAFVSQYNSTQNVIKSYVKIDTSNSTNNGVLSNDGTVTFLPTDLRSIFSNVMNSNSSIKMLSDLGIDTNSSDNTVTSVDETKLNNALTNNLSDVIALFTDSTKGMAAKLNQKVDNYTDSVHGSIIVREQNITDQQSYIAQQITQMQARVDAEIARMRDEFSTMESAYSSSQTILTSLSKLGSSSSS